MANIITKTKDAAASLLKGAFKLRDGENIDSQFEKDDLAKTPPDMGESDQSLKNLGDRRYEEAKLGRWREHERMFTGLAFFDGKHDSYWNIKTDRMEPINPHASDVNERFTFKYANIVRPLAERCVARMMAEWPDAWASPLTGSPADKEAAKVARMCTGHGTRRIELRAKLRQTLLRMVTMSTTFIEVGWDNLLYADVGIVNKADGSITYHDSQIGDVCANVLLPIDAFPDPNAALHGGDINKGAYFVKRYLMSTPNILKKWGVSVAADSDADIARWMQQRLEWIADDHSRAAVHEKHCAVITEVWELPGAQFPKGRYWVYSGETMCHKGNWPYTKGYAKNHYPFVPFWFQENVGSVWALNMVGDIIPIQMSINEIQTYLNGRIAWDRPVILAPNNANIAPDDYKDQYYGKLVGYDPPGVGGAEPHWFYPPPVGNLYQEERNALVQMAEYIAGVRDFNSDGAIAPNSTAEFQLRMQEDKSRLGPVIERVAEGVVHVYELMMSMYEQFGASFPRLMAMEDTETPGKDQAATGVADLEILKQGNYRFVLQPGSGEGKLPAAQDEDLMETVKAMATMPSPLVEFFLSEKQSIRSDANVDRLVAGLRALEAQEAASKPNPQAAAAAAAQAAQAIQAQKSAAELEQAQKLAEIQEKVEQAKAAIGVHSAAMTETWRQQTDKDVEQQRHTNAMELLQAKANTPSVSLSGKLGPVGTGSAEEAAGLKADDPGMMTKILAPPKPTPQAPAKGKTDGSTS